MAGRPTARARTAEGWNRRTGSAKGPRSGRLAWVSHRPPPRSTSTPPGQGGRERAAGSERERSAPPSEHARAAAESSADSRVPSWLAFMAGAALVLLGYGALREPERPAKPRATSRSEKQAPSAPRRSAAPRGARALAERRPLQPSPTAWVGPDAGLTLAWDDVGEDEPTPESPPPAPARTPPNVPRARHAHPDAGTRATALPSGHPALDELPADEVIEAPSSLGVRRVEVSVIRRWQQPGLCDKAGPAAAARRTMMAQFRRVAWGQDAIVFVDPRMPPSVARNLFAPLENAENEISAQLGLQPARPDVFAYRDTQLLLAGGCTNDNVVAYYDGDLHVVATHADVQQSITHEYTHHALMTAGLVAPAWAQEGIAMNVARETWWQTGDWLDRVAAHPYTLDIMERSVPYTMSSDQALAFYVQAAAMVQCASLDDPDGIKGLFRKLSAGSVGGTVEYELPPIAEPSAMRSCTRELLERGSNL